MISIKNYVYHRSRLSAKVRVQPFSIIFAIIIRHQKQYKGHYAAAGIAINLFKTNTFPIPKKPPLGL
jgi:hypothetical protein